MVELSKTPINETQFTLLVINHHIVRLHIAVHDAHGVTILESLQQLVNVVPDVVIRQRGIQRLEVKVVDVLEDQAWSFGDRVSHNIQQLDDVLATGQILQNFNLTFDFFLLHRLQDLNDTLRAVVQVCTSKHFAVFTSTDLAVHFIDVLITDVSKGRDQVTKRYTAGIT